MTLEEQLIEDVEYFKMTRNRILKMFIRSTVLATKNQVAGARVSLVYMRQILDERNKELKILTDFLVVLEQVRESTYWVFNLKDEDQYQKLLKERKVQIALYKRKIKTMVTLLKSSVDSLRIGVENR